jgi:hypothetical protein
LYCGGGVGVILHVWLLLASGPIRFWIPSRGGLTLGH